MDIYLYQHCVSFYFVRIFGDSFVTLFIYLFSKSSGIKVYSDWPTIPQLYVAGEFIGGSDIMIDMYQSGELGEMIEKQRADMI